jgi:ABC-type dipeptide/oligopeptide/nickel transport system permease component
MEPSNLSEWVSSCLGGMVLLTWALYSLLVVGRILRITSHVWKNDWFWFPLKTGFYVGAGLGFLWAILATICFAFFPHWGFLPVFFVQVCASTFALSGEKLAPNERMVWYAIPFFTLPFWFAYRQGQKEGVFPGPNP